MGEAIGDVAQRSPSATVTKSAGRGRPSPAYCRGHGLMANRCKVDRRCAGVPRRSRACVGRRWRATVLPPLAPDARGISRAMSTATPGTRRARCAGCRHRPQRPAPRGRMSTKGGGRRAPRCHRVVRENLATLYAAVEQGFASKLCQAGRHDLPRCARHSGKPQSRIGLRTPLLRHKQPARRPDAHRDPGRRRRICGCGAGHSVHHARAPTFQDASRR